MKIETRILEGVLEGAIDEPMMEGYWWHIRTGPVLDKYMTWKEYWETLKRFPLQGGHLEVWEGDKKIVDSNIEFDWEVQEPYPVGWEKQDWYDLFFSTPRHNKENSKYKEYLKCKLTYKYLKHLEE